MTPPPGFGFERRKGDGDLRKLFELLAAQTDVVTSLAKRMSDLEGKYVEHDRLRKRLGLDDMSTQQMAALGELTDFWVDNADTVKTAIEHATMRRIAQAESKASMKHHQARVGLVAGVAALVAVLWQVLQWLTQHLATSPVVPPGVPHGQ